MLDVDTFLTALYVMVDDFCHFRPPKEKRPGPDGSLSLSEVITLAIFSRWSRFTSERDFYRYAMNHLKDAFPTLPERSQFNRLVRSHVGIIEEVALHLVKMTGTHGCPYEALDSAAMVVRDAKRRGAGWLAGYADIGWSNRLGWYEGFKVLVAVSPTGVITGFGFSAASTAEQSMAETFLASRKRPSPRLPSVGRTTSGCYWRTRVSRGLRTTSGGSNATRHESSIPQKETAASEAGPRGSDAGWPPSARSWKRSTTNSSTLSVFTGSGPTS
jgi:hypothetical protein